MQSSLVRQESGAYPLEEPQTATAQCPLAKYTQSGENNLQ